MLQGAQRGVARAPLPKALLVTGRPSAPGKRLCQTGTRGPPIPSARQIGLSLAKRAQEPWGASLSAPACR